MRVQLKIFLKIFGEYYLHITQMCDNIKVMKQTKEKGEIQ